MPVIINGTTGISGTDGSAGTPALQGTDTNTGMFFPAADQIAFAEGGVEAMRLNASGNVGIGTSSPSQRLDVVGNVVLSGQNTADQFIKVGAGRTGNGYSYIDLQGDTTYGNGLRLIRLNTGANAQSSIEHRGTGDLQLVTYESAPIAFYTSGAERMRVTAGGNVGIGTSSPTQRLDIVGGNARMMFNVSTGSAAALVATVNPANNAYVDQIYDANIHAFRCLGSNKFFIDTNRVYCLGNSGSRGINGNVLTVTNDSLGGLFRNAGYIEFNSDVGAIGLNYFVSDENKKDNIQPSTFSSSALISNIRFISFDWKPDTGQSGHVDVGVSAQQLRSLDERLTSELADGSLMVNEPALVAHLGKALQEALAKIDALEARIAALEAR